MRIFRFIIEENLNDTGISFFAVFDGHGGEFAADYAKDFLVPNIQKKITETVNILIFGGKTTTTTTNQEYNHISNNKSKVDDVKDDKADNDTKDSDKLTQRKTRKTYRLVT